MKAILQGNDVLPRLIKTKFEMDDVVVTDYIVTEEPYNADPTGKTDSTAAIQRALNDAYKAGGGTVWMPAGQYLIKKSIDIPNFVTLRGDWQDPDSGNIKSVEDYGTLILADVSPDEYRVSALFTIGGSAGVKGLTVYYTRQDAENIKPFPFTFYIHGTGNGYMLQSIEDCTVINGYYGVGCTVTGSNAHEMLTIDTLKGTFLKAGAELYNSADVGTSKNIYFSNSYWANAPTELDPPKKEVLDAYTLENGTGMIIGDLEWTQFSNVNIYDYKIGINVVEGHRIQFAGAFYGLTVKNAEIGIKVDSIDERWGMHVASSTVEGREYAVQNNTNGVVKLADVELIGGLSDGKTRYSYSIDEDDLSAYAIIDHNAQTVKPKEALYIFPNRANLTNDIGPDLQEFLNSVAEQGGGIVYLPAGIYILDTPINIPAGVQLRGSGSVPTRDQGGESNGTLLSTVYGRNVKDPETDQALVTLAERSGIRNIRFVYRDNNPSDGKVEKYSYTIRGAGKDVYLVNVAINAAYYGVDFTGCDNFMIKKLISCCYKNDMKAENCKGGHIEGCLHNATVMLRSLYLYRLWGDVNSMYDAVFSKITRPFTEYVMIKNCEDILYYNSFAYGVNSFIISENNKNLRIINIGSDNIGGIMLEFNGGDATVINTMRYNGYPYKSEDCSLVIYNRLSINVEKEENVKKR
ncbi:MAG: hypothetical protein E7623_00305 [Ruminococcaceae bacterium]|nr:hypothetical protein [Oscillospiraceae bacterium]